MSGISSIGTVDVPEPVARLIGVMSGFDASWCLCGGWALDAWLGRPTREHHDVDIVVFEPDLPALARHLAGWSLVAHDELDPDSTQPWRGRRLRLPAHVHSRLDGFEIDVQVGRRVGGRWQLSRTPRLSRAIATCVTDIAWGIPALAPELVLYYKAIDRRDKDDIDLAAALPQLAPHQMRWLHRAVARGCSEHPWLPRLTAPDG